MKSHRSVFYPLSIILIIALSINLPLYAAQVNVTLNFPAPSILEVDGYHQVKLPGAVNLGTPGEPCLPSAGFTVLLHPGEHAVSATLVNPQWRSMSVTYYLEPFGTPYSFSDPNIPHPLTPNPVIYGEDAFYPGEPVSGLHTHLKCGYSLANCLVWPVKWNPVRGELEYMVSAQLLIQTEIAEREQTGYNNLYRGDLKTRRQIEAKVVNPAVLADYPNRDDGELEAMLVVTDEGLIEVAEEYASWRNTRGMKTYVETTQDIEEEEQGDDLQERIRNKITSTYIGWNVKYVLLLGDTDLVPHRGLWGTVNDEIELDIPADLYYSGLDGNWNNDNDERWGELNEADLEAEVFVGRIPAGDPQQAHYGLNKVYLYSDAPVADNALDVLMLGEELGWNVMGGDYMDEVYEGSDRWDHNTIGYPERFNRTNLYDRDREWNAIRDLAPLISNGYNFINHLGHASTRGVFKFGFNDIDDNLLGNEGEENGFNIAYSQGCYCGAFDNRTTEVGNYVGDCIGEKFVTQLQNGFVAFLCNSRYGWGNGQNTAGASQFFHRQFVDALFRENLTTLGAMNHDSKEDCIPWTEQTVMLWCYYEMNLLGDPALDVWTDEPGEMEPEHLGALVIGEPTYEVEVPGVEGAVVCLSRDGSIISAAETDENGATVLEIDEPIDEPGLLTLTVTAHDYLMLTDEVEALRPEAGYPWVNVVEITDFEGNEDGQADAGERIELCPLVNNLGSDVLEGLSVSITTNDPAISVIRGLAQYPDIQPESAEMPEVTARIAIDANCLDLHEAVFTLSIEDGAGNSWEQEASIVIHAPLLTGHFITVLDPDGNGNARIDPGEDTELILSLTNIGTGRVNGLTAELTCDNPMVEVTQSHSSTEVIEPAGDSSFDETFRLSISDECPDPYRTILYFRLSGDRGFHRSFLTDIEIGGEFYNFDNDEDVWNHMEINEEDIDQWHLCENDNYSPGGSACIKVGAVQADDNYSSGLNCIIRMPEFTVTGPVQLVFMHKMNAENSNNEDGAAFDGGFLEARIIDGDWEEILPESPYGDPGYPYRIIHGQSENPLAEDQACYSGEFDWQPAVFDLSDFEDETIEIRFHFGSDGSVQREGWWIDDIQTRLPSNERRPDNLEGEMTGAGAYLTWTSPILPRNDDYVELDQLVGYRIYRGIELLDTLVQETRFFDRLIGQPRGEIDYIVTAQYTTRESNPTNMVTLYWWADVEESELPLPVEWKLEAAWPNPFNNLTNIAYSLPEPSEVNLSVFDINGRQVAELVNGYRQNGSHNITLDANGLGSGVYFVRLNTQQRSSVIRIALLR